MMSEIFCDDKQNNDFLWTGTTGASFQFSELIVMEIINYSAKFDSFLQD